MLRFVSSAFALVALVAPTLPGSAAHAASKQEVLKQISRQFSSVPSMTGNFVQFGPKGEQTSGKFYLARPGRIRFDYAKPAALTIKADGRTVSVFNRKLKTRDYLPLSKTPLKLLLARKLNINDRSIKSVEQGPDLTTVVLADRKMFGASKITLMFDSKSYDLRQWTIRDKQGRDTSVIISGVKKNVRIPKKMFRIVKRREVETNR